MASIQVTHTIDDLESDCRKIATTAKRDMAKVVRDSAKEGNRIAKAFASEQHTMHTAIDVPYQASFSAEKLGALTWVYGPVADGIPHGGSQATGYELGSINQVPHLDLARSQDIIGPKFANDVQDLPGRWFWPS